MRDEYSLFTSRGAEILAVGPNDEKEFQRYWTNEKVPFVGLPDPDHVVASMYRQEVNLFKLGRMPLVCVIDPAGRIRFVHYGSSMTDISSNQELLGVIDEINVSSK